MTDLRLIDVRGVARELGVKPATAIRAAWHMRATRQWIRTAERASWIDVEEVVR